MYMSANAMSAAEGSTSLFGSGGQNTDPQSMEYPKIDYAAEV